MKMNKMKCLTTSISSRVTFLLLLLVTESEPESTPETLGVLFCWLIGRSCDACVENFISAESCESPQLLS